MRIAVASLLIALLIALPACRMNERLSGTLIGGVGGGIVGGVTGGGVGAVIGVAAGAVTGYLLGDYLADQRERRRPSVFGSASERTRPTVAPAVAHSTPAQEAYEAGRAATTAPEARRWYEESIRLDPTRPEPYNALALNALYAGDAEAARAYLRVALEKDPDYFPARFNLDRLRRDHIASR